MSQDKVLDSKYEVITRREVPWEAGDLENTGASLLKKKKLFTYFREGERGPGRGRERMSGKLHAECRARHRAQSLDPKIMT